MKPLTLSLMPILAVLAGGCDSPADPSPHPSARPAFARSDNAAVHQVTGGGELDVAALIPGADKETYGFSAIVDGAGNARGDMAINFSDTAPFHLDVTCLSVNGHDAWIGGVVTQTHDEQAIPVGLEMWVRVRDNGDAASDAPDQMSFFRFAPASFCALQRPAPLAFSWLHGNISVK
jgi:hypothetical protein